MRARLEQVGDTSSTQEGRACAQGQRHETWLRSCRWLSRPGGPQVPGKELE